MTTIVGHIDNGFLDRMASYKPYTVKVWLALVNRANKSGKCWPSITTIQRDTGLARPTVYRALTELVAGGEITINQGGGHGNPSNVYQFAGGPPDSLPPQKGSSPRELVPAVNWFPTETKVVPHVNSNQTKRTRRSARPRFSIPSVDEVAAYCRERDNQIDPQRFLDYYTANGWKVGRNSMKDWKAAVRTWEKNGFSNGNGNGKAKSADATEIVFKDVNRR
ncbi:MAG: helix-turn-helix domain-containing protein [Pirellulaceae bacterium]|nr:helix-turn-helix domain-containing protein [Pirellulaceae bacterium]